jgi:hypothetical protein
LGDYLFVIVIRLLEGDHLFGVVTRLLVGRLQNRGSFPRRAKSFSLFHRIQMAYGVRSVFILCGFRTFSGFVVAFSAKQHEKQVTGVFHETRTGVLCRHNAPQNVSATKPFGGFS